VLTLAARKVKVRKFMSLTIEYVNRLFENLSTGNGTALFDNVADDVHWTVMGTHPLAGAYKSKEDFLENTVERLDKVLEGGVIMKVDHTFVSGNIAVVEMTSMSTALNGNCSFWGNYNELCEVDRISKTRQNKAYFA
jgi:uncharacterized protein